MSLAAALEENSREDDLVQKRDRLLAPRRSAGGIADRHAPRRVDQDGDDDLVARLRRGDGRRRRGLCLRDRLRALLEIHLERIVDPVSGHLLLFFDEAWRPVDRAISYGGPGGPVASEIRSSFYKEDNMPTVTNFICGLAGRDVTPQDYIAMYEQSLDMASGKVRQEDYVFYGVRE